MYINGFSFIETRPGVWTPEHTAKVQVKGKTEGQEGWLVLVHFLEVAQQPTFGAALQQASELLAELEAAEAKVLKPSYAVVEGYNDITEYRNQRLVGRISGEAWGRGEGY